MKQVATKLTEAAGQLPKIGAVARALVGVEESVLKALERAARKAGIGEAKIAKAKDAKRKYDKAMALAWLLFPFMPPIAILRLIAKATKEDNG